MTYFMLYYGCMNKYDGMVYYFLTKANAVQQLNIFLRFLLLKIDEKIQKKKKNNNHHIVHVMSK